MIIFFCSSDGYVDLEILLKHRTFSGKYSIEDIKRVVSNNNKQRFKLRLNQTSNKLEIKANQGHSIDEINDKELKPIIEVTICILHNVIYLLFNYIKNHVYGRRCCQN